MLAAAVAPSFPGGVVVLRFSGFMDGIVFARNGGCGGMLLPFLQCHCWLTALFSSAAAAAVRGT